MIFVPVILIVGLRVVSSQDHNCDFVHQVTAGYTYVINSPHWPYLYSPGTICRWMLYCPTGYRCRLSCTEISLPMTPSCSLDRFLVSQTGDPLLTRADVYCGKKSLDILSIDTKMSVGLWSKPLSHGGRFTCRVTAKAVVPPPPPPPPRPYCRCGDSRKITIVGGNDTEMNEFPSMVGIAHVRRREIIAGGVIISESHVLTAGHVAFNRQPEKYIVIVGEHNVDRDNLPARKIYSISDFTIHPLYSEANYDYDIAIVTVAQKIEFNYRVGPACLPFKYRYEDFTGAKLTMLGWGTLFHGGPVAKILQKVQVDVINQNRCRIRYPSLTDRQICTYTPHKDACQRDSGGPLLYMDPVTNRLFVVGIISYGFSCATVSPGINTRVTRLFSWIQQNTPRINYCIV